MKKTLAIILVAVLAISSIVGVTAATSMINKHSTTNETSVVASKASPIKTDKELVLPDVTGTWQHENNSHCTVQVYNQSDNKIDFMIESSNESATKIATAKASVTLNLWEDGVVVRGDSDFSYTDSFGNTGTGSISVTENVILITFDNVDNTSVWGISNACGKYILKSKDVNENLPDSSNNNTTKSELTLPDITGTWKHENNPNGCCVQIYNQNNNTIDFLIESSNESKSKIATAKVSATLDLWEDGSIVRGNADFDFTDSFGNSGCGRISVSENVIIIAIDEINVVSGWSIENTAGKYFFAGQNTYPTISTPSDDNTAQNELTLPDVTGTWKHEDLPGNCNVQVYNQNGNTIDFMIESHNDSYTKIATAKVSVTLDLWYDGVVVRGDSDFSYTDSFGNTGTGSISVTENVILITFDNVDNTSVWGISNACGEYIFSSKYVNPTL